MEASQPKFGRPVIPNLGGQTIPNLGGTYGAPVVASELVGLVVRVEHGGEVWQRRQHALVDALLHRRELLDLCWIAATGRPGQWRIGPLSSPGSCRIIACSRPWTLRTSIMLVSTERGPCERTRHSVASTSGMRRRAMSQSFFCRRHHETSRSRLRSTHSRAAAVVAGDHCPAASYGSAHGSGGSGGRRP